VTKIPVVRQEYKEDERVEAKEVHFPQVVDVSVAQRVVHGQKDPTPNVLITLYPTSGGRFTTVFNMDEVEALYVAINAAMQDAAKLTPKPDGATIQ